LWYVVLPQPHSFTYDHRTLKIELPVRSAVLKQCTGGLVVRWVTTSEYPLLYVFDFFWLVVSNEDEEEKDGLPYFFATPYMCE
jgi:hypothetical protein